MNKIIQVENLIKKYRNAEKNAVDGISFYVEEGAFFSLLGPNGAGKTTTLSILTTTLSMTSGQVTIGGFDVDKDAHKIRQTIGVIFQQPSLDLNLTAEENVRIHAAMYGLYGYKPFYGLMDEAYKKRVGQLAEVLEIQGDMFKPIKTFSGGMKRKLEIIRSLMHKPKVLFLDEPTQGLDPVSRKNLWEYLADVRKKEKTTIFLTTHYLDEAEDCDYICIVNKGRVFSSGTPKDIKNTLTKHYISVKTDHVDRLTKELKAKKLKFAVSGDTGIDTLVADATKKVDVDLVGSVRIDYKEGDVHNLIRKIETPLTDIKVHSPTLEEAYIDIISHDNA